MRCPESATEGNMKVTLTCIDCKTSFTIILSHAKEWAIKNGYSVDVVCPKCRAVGMLTQEMLEKENS